MKTLLLLTSIFISTLFCQAAEVIDKKGKPERNINVVENNLFFNTTLNTLSTQFLLSNSGITTWPGNLLFVNCENDKVDYIPLIDSDKTGLQTYVYSVVDIFNTGYSLWNSHQVVYSDLNKNSNDLNVRLSLGKTNHGAGLKLTF